MLLGFLATWGISFQVAAQCDASDDSLTVALGGPVSFNVLDNDFSPSGFCFVQQLAFDPCVRIDSMGNVQLASEDPECCGPREIQYRFIACDGASSCFASLTVNIVCPKPECFLINLEDFQSGGSAGGPIPDSSSCAYACANASATYYVPYVDGYSYTWSVSGGSWSPGANDAEINVLWGDIGSGTITLVQTDSNGNSQVLNLCVEILESPVAAFTASTTTPCLGSSVAFTNTTTGASSYFWDFGDGNSSTLANPNYAWSSPGTYTVTLYATRDNYAPDGTPLCCCSDSTTLEITVDSLEGPNIECISTLCAGDSSYYWTDATGCTDYDWEVYDADGVPLTTWSGDGNDTIHVVWGDGPFGTIVLNVDGCDSLYCDEPTTATVPIVSSTALVNGPIVVCPGATETYTVPKWPGTSYDWSVTGGSILAGQGSHTVQVQWGTTPGTYSINVDWESGFLGGLPGQDPVNCMGSGDLTVQIRDRFSVSGPSPAQVCSGSSSVFTASPGTAFNWTVTPAASFTGDGSNTIIVTWDSGPGSFVVSAVPVDTSLYCNGSDATAVTVVELPPLDSISGKDEICPGSTEAYFAFGEAPGTVINWTVTGGSPATGSGNPITVEWDPSGPYSLSATQTQLNAPFCTSDPIAFAVTAKTIEGPLSITGPATACVNDSAAYALLPAQDGDASISWSILPPEAGSIINGAGTANPTVQWNNTAGPVTLQALVELCGEADSVAYPVTLQAAPTPNVTVSGPLCPGSTVTLDAGTGYASYEWSTGDLTQTTDVDAGGTYTVEVTDADGCTAVGNTTINALPAPVAAISSSDDQGLCINPPNSATVTMLAQTNPDYSFQWYCNGVLQPTPSPEPAEFVHTNNNTQNTYIYYVVVTDASTGCTDTSDNFVVVQDSCFSTGPGIDCDPRNHTITANGINQTPVCNTVDFPVSFSGPVTLLGWNFGDPLSNTNDGTLAAAEHTYAQAGCYPARLTYSVPENPPGSDICTLTVKVPVCVPLAAAFDYTDSCGLVSFTDFSTFLPGEDANAWFWDFDDGGATSTAQNPSHSFGPGSYDVTLTVYNASGCEASITQTVTVAPLPDASALIAPNPACVDEPVSFASVSGSQSYLWDFGDGAENADPNPSHAYTMDGSYTVQLTVFNAAGCSDSSFQPMVVNPLPPEDTIVYAPSLTVCEGESVVLTAPPSFTPAEWTDGSTGPTLTVSTSGSYGVTVTDANGCSRVIDPVEVLVLPAPVVSVSGDNYICDAGCVTLNAPVGSGYTYQWQDGTGTDIPFATGPTFTACTPGLVASGYQVVLTDANGCSAVSDPFVVSVAVSPTAGIDIVGDTCAPGPNVLNANPVVSGIVYVWNNGTNGPTTTVYPAGVYSLVAIDTATGCSDAASVTIDPLPDLCLVPTGCYTVCDPDTVCGPPGMASYQWNLNGSPMPGETNACLIVTGPGTYTLTATNASGCSATSDPLDLNTTDCDSSFCDLVDASVHAADASPDSCCWALDLSNAVPDYFIGVRIDALGGVDLGYGGSPAGWNLIGSSASHVSLLPPALGFVPTGSYSGDLAAMAEFCLGGYADSVQTVVVSWLVPGPEPLGYLVECTDTLVLDCAPEGCVELINDSIYCDGDTVKIQFDVVNGSWTEDLVSLAFPVLSPAGAVLVNDSLNLPVIAPLDTAGPFTLCFTGLSEGDVLSFMVMAHNDSLWTGGPMPSYCCTDSVVYSFEVPPCDPCASTHVDAKKDTMECCYTLTLFNSLDDTYFTGIRTTLITPGATFGSITGAFPLGWVYAPLAPNQYQWTRIPLGSGIPLGATQLPKICLDGFYPDTVELVIEWLHGTGVACRDTVQLICEPTPDPCVDLLHAELLCDDEGNYVFSFQVTNNSGYTVNSLDWTDLMPAGVSLPSVPLSLPDGATSSVLTVPVSGSGAVAGDTLKFRVTLHALSGGYSFACCASDSFYCFVFPPCQQVDPCDSLSALKDDKVKVSANQSVLIDVLANDACMDGYALDPGSVTVISGPDYGIIGTINPVTGQIGYSPNPGTAGTIDQFVYEVCCVDAVGNTYCCTATVTVGICKPFNGPIGLDATLLTSQALFTWDSVAYSDGCQIEGQRISPTPVVTGRARRLEENLSSLTVPLATLGAPSIWRWRVRCACSLDPVEVTPFSEYDTLVVPAVRLASPEGAQVTLYPNPVQERLTVLYRGFPAGAAQWSIVDAQGKVRLTGESVLDPFSGSLELGLPELAPGSYSLRLMQDDRVARERFIKME